MPKNAPTLPPGTSLHQYQILGPLGSGGMAEVYRALDTRLRREVAIKVLPKEFAEDIDWRSRFQQEAQALASLSHPHILSIHDLVMEGEVAYSVTELLEGETLRSLLSKGAVPWRQAVQIAADIAEGLAAAHSRNIVHRDLKPENIFLVEEGRVKILDFGLARVPVSHEAETGKHTQPGTLLGTVPYMSPEQARGLPVDHRTDIFSFGAILYEMITGKSAFSRNSMADTLSAILHENPPMEDVPDPVARIVEQCLKKEPSERTNSARDIAVSLRSLLTTVGSLAPVTKPRRSLTPYAAAAAIAVILVVSTVLVTKYAGHPKPMAPVAAKKTAPAKPEQKRIVVLPFENLGKPEDQYFAEGMTEEITSRLSAVGGLAVISRTSALQYKNSTKAIPQIGKELNVDYVLEGTVRWEQTKKDGSKVRITPQLIRVADDTHVWADQYDRIFDEIFTVQSEIAERIIQELDVKLLDRERETVESTPTQNMEAYRAYLRGMDYARHSDWSEQDLRLAVEMLERATRDDPKFLLAQTELARTYALVYHLDQVRSTEPLQKAAAILDQTRSLNPDLPQLHVAQGYLDYWGNKDYPKALEEFGEVAKILPNDPDVLQAVGFIRRRQGQFEDSVKQLKKALDLSPRDGRMASEIGITYMVMHQPAEADRFYDLAISLSPDQIRGYMLKAYNGWLKDGDLQKVKTILSAMPALQDQHVTQTVLLQDIFSRDFNAALQQTATMSPGFFESTVLFDRFVPRDQMMGIIYEYMGKKEEAKKSYQAALAFLEKEQNKVAPNKEMLSSFALIHAGLGESDKAIEEATQAVQLSSATPDALYGPQYREDLAAVYARTGHPDEAVAELKRLLSEPSWTSAAKLRIDPIWDPIRSNPAFRQLLMINHRDTESQR